MRKRSPLGYLFASLSLLALPSCQTHADMTPATLSTVDTANIAILKTVLGKAMGRADIQIAATDLTAVTHVSVLPPPPGEFETHSVAMPVAFDIVLDKGVCGLLRRDTGEYHAAPGLACRPATD
jgi:hypothetical protein